jgi:hypothetical protein
MGLFNHVLSVEKHRGVDLLTLAEFTNTGRQ